MNDTRQAWGYHHLPLVKDVTQKNSDIRRSLRSSGVIPDADGLCARSYTDCNNPEVMFYTVYSCHNQTEVSFFRGKMGREI